MNFRFLLWIVRGICYQGLKKDEVPTFDRIRVSMEFLSISFEYRGIIFDKDFICYCL